MLVLVAEPDANLRAALCVWVGHVMGAGLAGVARNSRELLPALRTSQATLVLLDWELLAGQVERVLAEARYLEPAPRIVVLAVQPELIPVASTLGVDAVVDKGQLPDALFDVVYALGSGATPGEPRAPQAPARMDGE